MTERFAFNPPSPSATITAGQTQPTPVVAAEPGD
jgi:hypothetical protein